MVSSILDEIKTWTVALFATFHFTINPLWVWYFYGMIFFIICVIVAYFLPFKYIRAALGFALLLVGAFIAGGRQMHSEMADQLKKAKTKPKPVNTPPPDHSIFSDLFG